MRKCEYDELDIEELKEIAHIGNSSSNFEQYIRALNPITEKALEEIAKAYSEIMKKKISAYPLFIGKDPLPDRNTLNMKLVENLERNGVNLDKIKHGVFVDEKGVTGLKGWEYEVDFYEVADNEVYIFGAKNKGDKDAIKQLLDRKLLLESKGKKVTKMFLLCYVISKKDKELAEKLGITVIAGEVEDKS